MGTRKKGSVHSKVLRLTPAQQVLVREHTGKNLDRLNLDDCQDRLIVDHLGAKERAETYSPRSLVLQLTSKQKDNLRRLTGKSFSEVKIRSKPC